MIAIVIDISQWIFLLYVVGLNLGYMVLNISALFSASKYMETIEFRKFIGLYAGFMPPVSILVPAYNEEMTIETTVRSLMQLDYPEMEVVVINDGSKDKTIDRLIDVFELYPLEQAFRTRLATNKVRAVYCSPVHANLRVVDKENGGKADALNAGINISQYPLFCCIDADSVLERDALKRVVMPFVDDPLTVASGGTVRIANGCQVRDGFLLKVELPRNLMALVQIVEYLRAFLFGRLGWMPLNALLVISGAFGVFHKETVIAAGAYRRNTIGEDMELVVRLHKYLRSIGRPYRITFVPDPVCWTEAPEDLKTLRSQRIRWQQGLAESLAANLELLFNRRGGAVGWFAFPFMLFFEGFGPVIEVCGYIILALGFLFDYVTLQGMLSLLILSISLSVTVSVVALLLEELTFHVYSGFKNIAILFIVAILENFGYRQITAVWRVIGLFRWATGRKATWGTMVRKGTWMKT